MFVTYTPENPVDGDAQEWVFDPGRVRASEGQVILREFGQNSWDLFVQGVQGNDLHARRVLLWHLLRRTHPLVRFADTPDFYADEMVVSFSSVELAAMGDRLDAVPAAQREMARAMYDTELAEALKREADMGKALSDPTSSPDSTTGG